jgi:hypothetical protein
MKKITSKLLLRIAAVIMLLHAVGHTLAIITWQEPNGKIPFDLVQKMEETHFSFQGKNTTIANFFTGHGYAGTIFLLLIVSILLTVSNWNNKIATKILWPVGASIILLSIVELIYFFPLAAIFSLIAAALVFVSTFQLNKLEK